MTVANHRAARRDAAPSTPPSASPSCGWRRGHVADARTTHVTHVSSPSDPLPDDVPSWTEAADSPAPSSRFAVRPASRIFCNRSLNMNAIAAVGFDMDYTLAMYRPETFEVLAYTQTCRKLVDVYGYPPEVLELEYDHTYMVRGLVVDKKRGNVLKMDRHKYVKVARHGFSTLGTDERLKTYCDVQKVDQFDGSNYANVDTLFALGETYLFCQLVERKEEARAEEDGSESSKTRRIFSPTNRSRRCTTRFERA